MPGSVLIILVAGNLIGLALLHLLWAGARWGLGTYWPGRDMDSLMDLAGGRSPSGRNPHEAETALVALLLLTGAMLLLGQGGLLPLEGAFVSWGAWAIAVALLLRGTLGFFDTAIRKYYRGLPYERLNRICYTPYALLLGLAALTGLLL
ncbi:MAG: DUF3995 domain-containing protein [Deltaproteobacteria bacterium]|nr:DUF3995 domain-containing protein [Deltaproteobacteria bacterium]